MMNTDSLQYIDDILDAIEHINTYLQNKTLEDFESDDLLFDAVIMRMQTIGESSAKIPDNLKQNYDKIPWKQIIGLRNFISHAYAYLDAGRVWMVIQNDLPKLKVAITNMRQEITK